MQSPPRNQKSVYRQKGYSCNSCQFTVLVFGRECMPHTCPNCASTLPLKLEWDHIVTSTTTVEDIMVNERPLVLMPEEPQADR